MNENSCTDSPDSRDWEYEPVFGASTRDKPTLRIRNVQNQGLERITRMACTRYAMAHSVNAMNDLVTRETGKEFPEVMGKELWLEYLKSNPWAEASGATLQSALEQARKNGLITAYAKCTTSAQVDSALDSGRPIFTGSQVGDWGYVTSHGEYRVRTDGRIVGHAIMIYDRTVTDGKKTYWAMNSYGMENWPFAIPEELLDTLFTRYAVADATDEEAILSYRKRTMEGINIEDAKKAYELGLWNGQNPTAPITREEASALVFRALQKAKAE